MRLGVPNLKLSESDAADLISYIRAQTANLTDGTQGLRLRATSITHTDTLAIGAGPGEDLISIVRENSVNFSGLRLPSKDEVAQSL
jgi:hypothetical protein